MAAHATRLGEKLRREGLGTDHVTVFVAVLAIAFAMTPDDELNAAANATAVGDTGMPPTFAFP